MIDEQGVKWLPTDRLIALLKGAPSDSRITPNAVGNLLIMSANGEDELGYIDLRGQGDIHFW